MLQWRDKRVNIAYNFFFTTKFQHQKSFMKNTFRFLSVAVLVFFTAVAAHAQYGNLNFKNTSNVSPANSISGSITFDKSVTYVPDPGYFPIPPISASGLVRSVYAPLGATTQIEPAGGHPTGYSSYSSYAITSFSFRIGGVPFTALTAAQIATLDNWGTVNLINFFGDGKNFTVTKTYNVSDIEIQINRTL